MERTTNKPVDKLRFGAVTAIIWQNEGENGPKKGRYRCIGASNLVGERFDCDPRTSPAMFAAFGGRVR